MAPHVSGNIEVQIQEVIRIENELNARSKCWGRILQIGSRWGQQDRVQQALTSTSSKPPPLYGLSKDHKVVPEGEEPPLRPVCGAKSGPGARLSNVLAKLISPCNDFAAEADLVDSTEDLQACFSEFNSLPAEERQQLVVFSMDAKALYPSIMVERSSEVVFEIMSETEVSFKNIDDTELQRYAAVVLSDEILQKHDLSQFVMTRKSKHGVKPTVTGIQMTKPWNEETFSWLPAQKCLDDDSRKKLMAVVVSNEVKNVMKKHLFRFKDKTFRQNEGGSIGSELTGVLGTSRMIVFLRKLGLKCESLGIKLCFIKAFVDDVSVGAKDPGKGYFLSDGELRWSAEKEWQDNNSNDDTRVAELIVQIANSLENEDDIQMTYDTPSKNVSKIMPVLDLQI